MNSKSSLKGNPIVVSPLAVTEHLTSTSMLALLAIGAYVLSVIISQIFGYKVPLFGSVSKLEPIVLSNFRFFRHAEDVLNEGYEAVRTSQETAHWTRSIH